MTLGLIGVSTTWLVQGVYRYEILRYDALTDFLVANQISGEIQVQLEPTVSSTIQTTLGYKFYNDDWGGAVLNWAMKGKGGQSVKVTENPEAVKLRWEPKLGWQVLRR